MTEQIDLKLKASKIKLLLLDVDNVLTDGKIIWTSNLEEIKHFNVQDGFGITMIHKAGIKTGIITARNSKIVQKRAEELKINYIYQGQRNKKEALQNIIQETSFSKDEIAYIGDDILDISVLQEVGFPITVENAVEDVKKYAIYVTSKKGGEGAVREATDLILELQNKKQEIINSFILAE